MFAMFFAGCDAPRIQSHSRAEVPDLPGATITGANQDAVTCGRVPATINRVH